MRKEHQQPRFIIEKFASVESKAGSLVQPIATPQSKQDSPKDQKYTQRKKHQGWVPGLDISRTP